MRISYALKYSVDEKVRDRKAVYVLVEYLMAPTLSVRCRTNKLCIEKWPHKFRQRVKVETLS